MRDDEVSDALGLPGPKPRRGAQRRAVTRMVTVSETLAQWTRGNGLEPATVIEFLRLTAGRSRRISESRSEP